MVAIKNIEIAFYHEQDHAIFMTLGGGGREKSPSGAYKLYGLTISLTLYKYSIISSNLTGLKDPVTLCGLDSMWLMSWVLACRR
jgi:hypothetical protein